MDTRAPHWRVLVLPAGFALVCIVLTIVLLDVFGGSAPFAPAGYRITVPVTDATNLVPGSGVEIAGVKIGRVVSVARAGNGARATVEIAPRFVPIRAGATAIDRTKTLLGEGYVEIAPGPANAPGIPDGGTLPAGQVRAAVTLDQFLSTFRPATRSNLHQLLGGLAAAFGGRAQALNDSLGYAAPFSSSLDILVSSLAAQNSGIQRLIANAGKAFGAIGTRAGDLQAAVHTTNQVLDATARESRALTATVDALPPFLATLHATADTIARASPVLNGAVRALTPVAPLVKPALTQILSAAPSFRGLFDELPGTLTAGEHGLPALTRIVDATKPALSAFEPTARNLIPFMQLLDVAKPSLGILANVAAVTNGTTVGSGGVVTNYAAGIPSIWNETISGWTHKLPTNRQNPYPKPPDALLETGTTGVLDAYDCRNIHNPLWLPPTGLGAPPCRLQGPWAFDGVNAYYPRLRLAAP